MKDFYRQKGAGTRKLYEAKTWLGYCKVTFLQEMAGVCQADDLANAAAVILDSFVQDSVSERVETVIKSQFGDMGLSTSNPIWGLLSYFLH